MAGTDAYFRTPESVAEYEKAEPRNVRYNLDLLARDGITPAFMKGRKVLDVGCGFGLLLRKFHDAGAACYGTDISELAVERCMERHAGIRVEQADCTQNPFGEKFSLVISFGVLGLVEKGRHALFLGNASRSLENGGVLFATAPNAARSGIMDAVSGKKRSASYNNARQPGEWEELLEAAGFEGIRVSTVLRLPGAEALLGRNVFLGAGGSGDPAVIFARKPAR